MASRIIAQLLVQGATIVSKAFVNGYHEALRNAKGGAAAAASANARVNTVRFKLRPDEALKILNIENHEFNRKILMERYDKMFAVNDPAKGGSFYIQSKIYRSKETLERELDIKEAEEEEAKAAAGGAKRDESAKQ